VENAAKAADQIRVLIVEDHGVVAEGLAALLGDQEGIEVVGIAASVAATAEIVNGLGIDVALLDFRLEDGTGVEASILVRRAQPQARIIFLSREENDNVRFAAVEAGASAFIHKSRAAMEVVDAVRRVAAGASLITPNAVAKLFSTHREADLKRESLTPREKDVLKLLAEGIPSREIAQKLGISYTTVRTHIRALGSKLGVHSKLEAVAKAKELGIIGET